MLTTKTRGSVLVLAMIAILVIATISLALSNMAKINQRNSTAQIQSNAVKTNAFNAAQYAINNLKLTPQKSINPPPSCNSIASCKAAPLPNGQIAFAWTPGTLQTLLGRTPNLVNDGEDLSFWQTYAYPITGSTTDYVLVMISGEQTISGVLYTIVGYSNVNNQVATYNTTYAWQVWPCDCQSLTTLPSSLVGQYGYWWNTNTANAQQSGGWHNNTGSPTLLNIGLPESSTHQKAWIDPRGGTCCDAYCRWTAQVTNARYVQIYFENNNTTTGNIINLNELEVLNPAGTDLALGIIPTMDSVIPGDSGSYLTDGVTNCPGATNITSTGNPASPLPNNATVNPWIQLDLGTNQNIAQLGVYNRNGVGGIYMSRLNGATLTLVDSNYNVLYSYNFANGASTNVYTLNPSTNITTNLVTGRYVWLYYNSVVNNGFSIREIQIFDINNNNLALNGTAIMSSVAAGSATYINDNNTATVVTTSNTTPWILVDLGSDKQIAQIKVYNSGNLTRARVAISTSANQYSPIYVSGMILDGGTSAVYTFNPLMGVNTTSTTAQYAYALINETVSLKVMELQMYNGASLYSIPWNFATSSSINTGAGYYYDQYNNEWLTTGMGINTYMGGYTIATCEAKCDTQQPNCSGGYVAVGTMCVTSQNFNKSSQVAGGTDVSFLRHYNCDPQNLVDNNTTTSGACTNADYIPWVAINNQTEAVVTSVNVYGSGSGMKNVRVKLLDTDGSTVKFLSMPFVVDTQMLYSINVIVPSTTITATYNCVSTNGENSYTPTAGSTYPLCNGYGVYTGTNTNGTFTIPSSYTP